MSVCSVPLRRNAQAITALVATALPTIHLSASSDVGAHRTSAPSCSFAVSVGQSVVTEENALVDSLVRQVATLIGIRLGGQAIPIMLSIPAETVDAGAENLTLTVQVDEVPMGGRTVQIGTNYPNLVVSPSGTWPYLYTFPFGGSTSTNLSFATNGVSANTTVQVYTCESGVDISNANNWRASDSVTFTP